MAGPQLDLMPGEKMMLHSHPHWWYFWKQVLAGVGLLLLLLLMWTVDVSWLNDAIGWLTLVTFLIWLFNTIYQFVSWQTTRFAVTDQRVAFQSGIVRRSGVSIPLNRINNVNFEQSVIARMLDNGTVTIESAGETGDSVFENIPNPEDVRSLIFAQVEADEVADSERDAAAVAKALRDQDPLMSGTTTAARLAQLDELRAKGVVSYEEYEAKRKQILEDL